MSLPLSQNSNALKEWQVAVDALTDGKTILLLRKGGIKEAEGKFTVKAHEVILYPTTEHQKPELLKSDYAQQVTPVAPGWHPETITIKSWAEITDILSVNDASIVDKLLPYHIWNGQFVQERLNWKPQQPLYLLLLRVHRLLRSQSIPYDTDYGGCRSWITLKASISLEGSAPAIPDPDYHKLVQEIKTRAG
jgi:hypothetical protein